MKIKAILLAACAAFLMHLPAHAQIILTLEEVGPDVVLTASGTIDLTGMTYDSSSTGGSGGVAPSFEMFYVGDPASGYDFYDGPISTTGFGPGSFTNSDSETGSPFGIGGFVIQLAVPGGYTSGDPLGTSTAIFDNTDLNTLGVTPGTYVWTWGTGSGSATMTVVPEPSSAALLAGGLAALALLRRRRNA